MPPHDLMITSGEVPLAVRDFGGDRPPVLLLHGAGGNLVTMTGLAEALRSSHRPITVDLRGHGCSGDAAWRWEAVLADLAATAAELGLTAPAVVGLSLGGMVAAQWAVHHPECPGAVNLDGHPTPSRPEQLPGLAPEFARAELARLHQTFVAMAKGLAQPMTGEQVAAARAGQRAMAAQHGAAEQRWLEAFDRNLVRAGDVTTLRPPPAMVEELLVAQQELDLLPVYRSAQCPLLLVLATEDLPQQREFHDLYAAYRRHVVTSTAAAAAENPRLRAVSLPGASHAMLAEQPDTVAGLVQGFLIGAQAAGRPAGLA